MGREFIEEEGRGMEGRRMEWDTPPSCGWTEERRKGLMERDFGSDIGLI